MPVRVREIQRKGRCRGCGKILYVGDTIVYAHDYRSDVVLCKACVKDMICQMYGDIIEDLRRALECMWAGSNANKYEDDNGVELESAEDNEWYREARYLCKKHNVAGEYVYQGEWEGDLDGILHTED